MSASAATARLLCLLFFLPLAPEAAAMGAAVPEPPGGEIVTVLFVADGDTVRVQRDGRREWVRLLRIDTPERDETGYEEAREALLSMVGGQDVLLVFESPGREERDRHGRLLAYLFRDGMHANVEIVRLGWSPFWTRYGPGRYARDFRRAESEARAARQGLWGLRR